MDAENSFTTTATWNVSLAVWPKKSMASGEDEGANRRRRPVHPVTVDAILDAT